MLTADDELPIRPRRVLVAGVSGSGKSTLCRLISEATGLPYTELDALYHGPGWTPREEFIADVERFTSGPEWVTEWMYRPVRELLLERADLLVWLDTPFRVTLRRVVARTFRRRLRREELWNGNVEPPLATIFTDREHIVRWSIATRHRLRERIPAVLGSDTAPVVIRLRSPAEVRRWLTGPLRRAMG